MRHTEQVHGPGGHHHHGDHGHTAPGSLAQPRWLWVALGLNLLMALLEVVAGIISGSTALLADAAHVVTDALAIGIALASVRIAQRPAGGRYTYGLARVEILGAQINGASLLLLAGMLGVGGVLRLLDPPQVDGTLVVVAGLFGIAGNILAAWALARASRQSLAVEGAYQHALMDALGSAAAIVAGIIVLSGGPDAADPVLALLVTAVMVRSGWQVLRGSISVLLEAAPAGVSPDEVGQRLAGVTGVAEVHDLHVWELTQGFAAVTAHVLVRAGHDCNEVRLLLERELREGFAVEHSTLQVQTDHRGELVQLGGPPPPAAQ